MQASHFEACVRQAIVALASLHEKFENNDRIIARGDSIHH
jgi:hypothetical protein